MVGSVDRQICFRLPEAGPAASPVGPFRLGDMQAEALSELLQGFACGEESAVLAFAHLGGSPLEDAARRGLARVAEEELIHERLLRGMRAALPAPAPDRELRRIHRDEGRHVRLSRRLAPELADRDAIGAVAENARLGLVDLLARRGAEFECLYVDAGRLFARIARVPIGL